jgi:signal transduction histidine kinase
LRNFVSNAIKFTPPNGKVSINMKILRYDSEEAGSEMLQVEVVDSGHGISLENQRKVFNEIVQFHANTQQGGGGSGLGLWISKKIVDLHGGRVGLFSEGEGTG